MTLTTEQLKYLRLSTTKFSEGSKKYANIIMMAQPGAGKTSIIHTLPGPILVDSFDPNGLELPTIKKGVEEGRIFVDTSFENEDHKTPKAYKNWIKTFVQRGRTGIYKNIQSYVIDSTTMWMDAMMNCILEKQGRAGEKPYIQDYQLLEIEFKAQIRRLLSLDMNIIMNCHEQEITDDKGRFICMKPMTTGKKAQTLIPLQFSEIWLLTTQGLNDNIKHVIQTKKDNRYKGLRTRMGADILDKFEPANYASIFKKCGYAYEDYPVEKEPE